ncbi:MAG: T9SS type A sorting domain-containing protein, partial [candidate division Zixibacteria bacterium]|nr:T9SS type A sorting domain-containing protein [candidate division Zixibacteria bacterium]
GYGIVNIIAHGSGTLFEVRTSVYNQFPKTRFTTDTTSSANGAISHLAPNGRTSLYYSLACDNGAFDYDYPESASNLVVTTLALPDAGAIAFVANSRWGWVGSSHLLQRAFFDSAFAHPDRPAVAAMYDSKLRYHYVRDVVYGQNFYGDPTLIMYDDVPGELTVEVYAENGAWDIDVSATGKPVANCLVVLSDTLGIVERIGTDDQGHVTIWADYEPLNSYTVAAVKPGFTIELKAFVPSIAADVDDRVDDNLPRDYGLSQNYPNPFNPQTIIEYELAKDCEVEITVYNILGRKVRTLVKEFQKSGQQRVKWDGKDEEGKEVSSGIYFYQIKTPEFSQSKKMVLLR